ncbi:hypothetical protein QUH70_01005 [Staphylococcus felis]|uniref:Phage protein n=1 Tax=Staphylococcus felis TaxID=46127 RepID=A0ABS0QP45_9STAP|nr:hypothetical protein [Staphylococcus felis]MBH9580894.1 hypothetical protein [Staphylococcus felis]MDM8326724.1 hypothetical protein [Staphylococcus felis]
MWMIIILIFVSLLLVGSMIENGKLQGEIKAKEYEVEMLRQSLRERE